MTLMTLPLVGSWTTSRWLCASTMMGSTETTFYVLTVYFGAVQIKKIRHTLAACLIADAAGITSAIVLGYLLFG